MPVEGAIQIHLAVADGLFSQVDIRNRRLLSVTASLAGRPAHEVPGLVSRLFSICRTAQGLAALDAFEQTQGIIPTTAQRAARRFLINGETVLEHAGRACLDWTQSLGEPPALAALKSLRGALANLPHFVFPGADGMRFGDGDPSPDVDRLRECLLSVETGLNQIIFGTCPPLDPEKWDVWLASGETVAARLAARLRADGLADFGAVTMPVLPEFDRDWLEAKLTADHDGSFVACPDWNGTQFLTGPLARQRYHPVVAAIVDASGQGLLAQLAARVVELGCLLREMWEYARGLCDDHLACHQATGGMAIVEAARGRLVHRVEQSEGIVTRYQILAPTEWNFHPRGPLVQGLLGRPAGDNPKARVTLLVAALDPCVSCQIEGP
jgi:hypothetical protein